MAGDDSDTSPSSYPMPGPTDFTADEEKQMRAANNAMNLPLGSLPLTSIARKAKSLVTGEE